MTLSEAMPMLTSCSLWSFITDPDNQISDKILVKIKWHSFITKKEIYLHHIYRMSHNVFLRLLSYDALPPSAYQEPIVTRVQEVLCQDSQVLKFLIAKRVLFGHSNRYKMTIHEINICTVDLYVDLILYLNPFQVSMVQEKIT